MRIFRRLRALPRQLSMSTGSASADVERAIAALLIALRACILVTVLTAMPEGVSLATHVAGYLVCTTAIVVFAMMLGWAYFRSGRPDSTAWGVADVVLALGCLYGIAFSFPTNVQTGTWSVWAPGYSLIVAVTVGAWARPRLVAVLGLLIGVSYLLVTSINSDQPLWSLLANALNYPMLALAASWIAAVLRRFARQADRDREAAAASAAALETERYRLLVHDTTGILRLLASDELPEETRTVVREQALAESARLRSYLDSPAPSTTTSSMAPPTLGELVREVMGDFRDLPLEPLLTLGERAQLDPETADVLRSALSTTLHNVRQHARAEQVVTHADLRGQEWELTVRDDGVGFDTETTTFGFGISNQIFEQSGSAGIDVDLQSSPGDGTALTFFGVCAGSTSGAAGRGTAARDGRRDIQPVGEGGSV